MPDEIPRHSVEVARACIARYGGKVCGPSAIDRRFFG
jgi:hypothetical protein